MSAADVVNENYHGSFQEEGSQIGQFDGLQIPNASFSNAEIEDLGALQNEMQLNQENQDDSSLQMNRVFEEI